MSQKVLCKEVLATLEEFILPQRTALILVDMQNDFCSPKGYFGKLKSSDMASMNPCIENLKKLLEAARQRKVMVIYTKATNHPEGAFRSAPDLMRKLDSRNPDNLLTCIDGSWGHEIVDELKPLSKEIIIKKYRHNSFIGSPIDILLRTNGIETVIVTGVTTERCVLATVAGAIARDYYVVVPRDCVASLNLEIHKAALLAMSANLSKAEMSDSTAIIKIWSRI